MCDDPGQVFNEEASYLNDFLILDTDFDPFSLVVDTGVTDQVDSQFVNIEQLARVLPAVTSVEDFTPEPSLDAADNGDEDGTTADGDNADGTTPDTEDSTSENTDGEEAVSVNTGDD